MRYLGYVQRCFRMSVYRAMEYRWGIAVQYLLDIVWYLVQYVLLRTAYNFVDEVGGYSLQEAYLFMGFLFMTDAINMTLFAGGLNHFTRAIRHGGLDFYLLKPMPTLFQLSVARVNLAGLPNLLFTTGFWIYTIVAFDVSYPLERWAWAAALFLNGTLLNVTFRFFIACFSFWTVEGGTLNWLFHELTRFGHKPENIYGAPYRYLLSSIIPALLFSAWPCMALVRETSWTERLFPFAVGLGSIGALAVVWRVGVRRYEGLSFGSNS